MLPDATLCHSSRGRVRVRIAALRRDDEYFRSVERGLVSQFEHVVADSTTGSVLVTGESATPAALRQIAAERGLFALAAPVRTRAPAGAAENVSSERDWSRATALLFAGLALIQAARGTVLAPASSLAWYAVEALRWGRRQP